MTKGRARRVAAACLVALQAMPAWGQDEAFALFEEEAKVMAASRREQSVSEAPLAVDVVTREEILASGARSLPDLLRFRVGLDVVDGRSIDGNRAIVSVRGFPHEFAGNTLVLVDGRNVYSANQGGVYWERIPLPLSDIERIEIVRGPNSALYGTGAGVGVINIVTRKPGAAPAAAAAARAGARGARASEASLETPLPGKASLRVTHAHRAEDGFPKSDAATVATDDSLRRNVVNARAAVPLGEKAELELFAGGSWSAVGLANGAAGERADFADDFQMARLTRRLAGGSLEATGSRSDARSSSNAAASLAQGMRQIQHDVELLHRFSWLDGRLDSAYGASYRNALLSSPVAYGTRRPRLEISRGFASQSARLTDRLSVQGAFSWESSDLSGGHPNYQAAAVLAPAHGHALRVSYSVSRTLRDLIPVHGDISLPDTRVLGSDALREPYRVTSYEAGYHASLLENALSADASVFYTRLEHLHQVAFESFSFPTTTLRIREYDDAIARGVELKLKYRLSREAWAYANYTHERVSDRAGDHGHVTRNTPPHKLNLGGRAALGRGWSAGADLGYKDAHHIAAVSGAAAVGVPAYWRLDARLAYAPSRWKGVELFLAGRNLLAERHVEFADGLSVPRELSAGASVRFGADLSAR